MSGIVLPRSGRRPGFRPQVFDSQLRDAGEQPPAGNEKTRGTDAINGSDAGSIKSKETTSHVAVAESRGQEGIIGLTAAAQEECMWVH